jgi:hypothetical protein
MAKSAAGAAPSAGYATAPVTETETPVAAPATGPLTVDEEPLSKRVQLQLSAEDVSLLEDVKRGMTIARNQTDTVLLSLKFVRWILSLQSQGYKLAMVKDDKVEAVQVFM